MSAIVMHQIKSLQMQYQVTGKYYPSELDFLLNCVTIKQNDYIYIAALLAFTEASDEAIDYLLDHHETLLQRPKYLLIPMLVCADYVRCYTFCFDCLETSSDEDEVGILVYSLSSTHFLIMPLIIERLITDSSVFLDRLKLLLKKMGFKQVEEYLALLPSIPHERIFRDVFGNQLIDQIKR
tara:strand:+ start:116 stop:658 length:543 start_codon:yes stop_codon:yes gene_type:complete